MLKVSGHAQCSALPEIKIKVVIGLHPCIHGCLEVKLQPAIEKNGVNAKCLSTLEEGASCFHEGKKS